MIYVKIESRDLKNMDTMIDALLYKKIYLNQLFIHLMNFPEDLREYCLRVNGYESEKTAYALLRRHGLKSIR